MKYLKKFNESPFFGSDWNDDNDEIGPLSHWDDDFVYMDRQFNLNTTSIQEIVDNYEFSHSGYVPKVLSILKMIQKNLINREEYLSIDYDKVVEIELKKIGFPVSRVENKLEITWSNE